MIIRNAGPQDIPALSALHADSWRDAYAHELDRNFLGPDLTGKVADYWSHSWPHYGRNLQILLAERDGDLLGMNALKYEGKGKLFVSSLHVRPNQTRGGVGGALLRSGFEAARGRDCTSAYLWVFTSNERARAFYAKQGGEERDREEQEVFGRWIEHVRVCWDLNG